MSRHRAHTGSSNSLVRLRSNSLVPVATLHQHRTRRAWRVSGLSFHNSHTLHIRCQHQSHLISALDFHSEHRFTLRKASTRFLAATTRRATIDYCIRLRSIRHHVSHVQSAINDLRIKTSVYISGYIWRRGTSSDHLKYYASHVSSHCRLRAFYQRVTA